jgi:hypothetical protein
LAAMPSLFSHLAISRKLHRDSLSSMISRLTLARRCRA